MNKLLDLPMQLRCNHHISCIPQSIATITGAMELRMSERK